MLFICYLLLGQMFKANLLVGNLRIGNLCVGSFLCVVDVVFSLVGLGLLINGVFGLLGGLIIGLNTDLLTY